MYSTLNWKFLRFIIKLGRCALNGSTITSTIALDQSETGAPKTVICPIFNPPGISLQNIENTRNRLGVHSKILKKNTRNHLGSQSLIWRVQNFKIHFNTAWKGMSDNTILSAYHNVIVGLSSK